MQTMGAQLAALNSNHIIVQYRALTPIPGFNHALILLAEQDGAKDQWQVVTKQEEFNGIPLNVIDLENASFPGGVNTSGLEDDVGGVGANRRLRLLPLGSNGEIMTTHFFINPSQPDTDPGRDLEFYVVAAMVAVGAGKPLAVFGDLFITATRHVNV